MFEFNASMYEAIVWSNTLELSPTYLQSTLGYVYATTDYYIYRDKTIVAPPTSLRKRGRHYTFVSEYYVVSVLLPTTQPSVNLTPAESRPLPCNQL